MARPQISFSPLIRVVLHPHFRATAISLLCLALAAFGLRHTVLHASEQARGARRALLQRGVERPKHEYKAGEILVRFRGGTSEQSKLQAHALVSGRVSMRFASVENLEKVQLPAGDNV